MSFHDSMYDDGFCSEEDYLDHLYDLAEREMERMSNLCTSEEDFDEEADSRFLKESEVEARQYEEIFQKEIEESRKQVEIEYKKWAKENVSDNIWYQMYCDIHYEETYKSILPFGEKSQYDVETWQYWILWKERLKNKVERYYGNLINSARNYYVWKENNFCSSFLIGLFDPGEADTIDDDLDGKYLIVRLKEWIYFNQLCKASVKWFNTMGETAINFRKNLIKEFNTIGGVSMFFEFYMEYYRDNLSVEGYDVIMNMYRDDRQRVLRIYFNTLFVRIICDVRYLCDWLELPNEGSDWKIRYDFKGNPDFNSWCNLYISNPYGNCIVDF